MTQPKALAFDLDGTLAESKQRPSSVMGDLISSLLSRMPVAVELLLLRDALCRKLRQLALSW
jgi:phosphoglycolate phosphatase-like HAD superfamily hydrolase